VKAPTICEKLRNQLGQMTGRYWNRPVGFHYELFFRLRQKPYIYIYTYIYIYNPHSSAQRAPGFQTPLCISLLSLSLLIVSFLPVTPMLHSSHS
jgi:hypothetical protein